MGDAIDVAQVGQLHGDWLTLASDGGRFRPKNVDLLFGRQQVFEASALLLAAKLLLEPCEPNAAGIRNPSS